MRWAGHRQRESGGWCTPSRTIELDLQRYELRSAGRPVKIEPQVFNLLAYLIRYRDHVVSKEELLEQLWPGRIVGETTLTSRVKAARQAIGDRGREQRLIQTQHGRGYRFLAPIEECPDDRPIRRESHRPVNLPEVPAPGEETALSETRSEKRPPTTPLAAATMRAVGREAELAQLHRWLRQALERKRQVVFVTDEAGLGKTTLVEAFLESIRDDAALDALQRRVMGATRDRMLREMAEAIEVLTAERPLILVLEDLHWSDPSTIDLIALLARRREPARLLILATYRPAEALLHSHPLQGVKHELSLHGQCHELPLRLLTEHEVAEYLATRFSAVAVPVEMTRFLHRRTEGNPLFMVNVVDYWQAQGLPVESKEPSALREWFAALGDDVPDTLRKLIEQQLGRLSRADQHCWRRRA